uniref:PABC domain-containing protein n=1 Tax=viral metagenome TaxID=1070528 RepID=A0A6C0DQ24_9ZZZZ
MTEAPLWPFNAELDKPEHQSPRPCKNGANCTYDGCCVFVHPGEQGIGRKLFPSRNMVDEEGVSHLQTAVVRLIGSPTVPVGFYERRHQRLSWPKWCEMNKLPMPVYKKKVLSHERREVIQLHQEPVATARPVTVGIPIMRTSTIPPVLVHQGIAYYPFPPIMYPEAQYAPVPFTPLPSLLQKQEPVKTKRDILGEELFIKIEEGMKQVEVQEHIKKLENNSKMTVGKITGMLLELDEESIREIIENSSALAESVLEACDVLAEVPKAN